VIGLDTCWASIQLEASWTVENSTNANPLDTPRLPKANKAKSTLISEFWKFIFLEHPDVPTGAGILFLKCPFTAGAVGHQKNVFGGLGKVWLLGVLNTSGITVKDHCSSIIYNLIWVHSV